jgi:hypothetical protein
MITVSNKNKTNGGFAKACLGGVSEVDNPKRHVEILFRQNGTSII